MVNMEHTAHNHNARSVLALKGLKYTKARACVYESIAAMHKPLSVDMILQRTPTLDMVTVYRILGVFLKHGIVREVNLRQGVKMYECLHEDDHHHIVCTSCKKVGDFDGCLSETMIRNALKQNKDFARVDTHSFELFGLCKKCYTKRI